MIKVQVEKAIQFLDQSNTNNNILAVRIGINLWCHLPPFYGWRNWGLSKIKILNTDTPVAHLLPLIFKWCFCQSNLILLLIDSASLSSHWPQHTLLIYSMNITWEPIVARLWGTKLGRTGLSPQGAHRVCSDDIKSHNKENDECILLFMLCVCVLFCFFLPLILFLLLPRTL